MFDFKNIDQFIPGKFEKMGMLKGKRWYTDSDGRITGLFKPQRKEFGNKRVFCANHYGEFLGYVLALNADMDVCEAELAYLSQYYENIHKVRHCSKGEEKFGCITYSKLGRTKELEHGQVVIDRFMTDNPEKFRELTKNDRDINKNDNIEVVLAAIEHRIRKFYGDVPKGSDEFIEYEVQENKRSAIEMMVYDCLYGNNDRHDENWAMVRDRVGSDIKLYSLYDNERVLGLYENQEFIEDALGIGRPQVTDKQERVERIAEETLFSRMRVPGETKKFSSYKDVLQYLVEHYREETLPIIEKHLRSNDPQIVQDLVASCEGLPRPYLDFQKMMYKARYDFAKELVERSKNTVSLSANNDTKRTIRQTDEEIDIV